MQFITCVPVIVGVLLTNSNESTVRTHREPVLQALHDCNDGMAMHAGNSGILLSTLLTVGRSKPAGNPAQ